MTRQPVLVSRMAARVDIGVDPGVPTDLQEALVAALEAAQFLVTPIVHPRYRRLIHPESAAQPRRSEPLTRSDLLLHSGQWGQQILGKMSPWLRLDSPHEAVRKRGEAAFKQEVQFGSHLAVPRHAVQLHPRARRSRQAAAPLPTLGAPTNAYCGSRRLHFPVFL